MRTRRERVLTFSSGLIFLAILAVALELDPRRMLLFLAGLTAVWTVLFFVIVLVIGLLDKRKNQCLPRYLDRLDIDDGGIRYTELEGRPEGIAWSALSSVFFYYGPPDYPDPLFGMTWVRHWELIAAAPYPALEVPDLANHSARLVQAFAGRLPGFSIETAEKAVKSSEQRRWLLWKRNGSA